MSAAVKQNQGSILRTFVGLSYSILLGANANSGVLGDSSLQRPSFHLHNGG